MRKHADSRSMYSQSQLGSQSPTISAPAADLDVSLQVPAHEIVLGATIASGGFGDVIKGLWRGLPVAIKFVKDDSSEMLGALLQEVQTMTRLHHPNIVQVSVLFSLATKSILNSFSDTWSCKVALAL